MMSNERIAELFPVLEQALYVQGLRDRFYASYSRFKELQVRDSDAAETILTRGRKMFRDLGMDHLGA